MKYELNIWYAHNGGECPINPQCRVEIAWREENGRIGRRIGRAGQISFEGNDFGDVISFRIESFPAVARKWRVLERPNGLLINAGEGVPGSFIVREVFQ